MSFSANFNYFLESFNQHLNVLESLHDVKEREKVSFDKVSKKFSISFWKRTVERTLGSGYFSQIVEGTNRTLSQQGRKLTGEGLKDLQSNSLTLIDQIEAALRNGKNISEEQRNQLKENFSKFRILLPSVQRSLENLSKTYETGELKSIISDVRKSLDRFETIAANASIILSNETLDDTTCLFPLHESVRNNDLKKLEDLLGKGFDINQRDEFGRTPLHLALVENSDSSVIRRLMASNPSLSIKDNQNRNAVDYAFESGQEDLLVDCNVPPSTTDGKGNSLLHIAIQKGNIKLVAKLWEAQFQNLYNPEGETPLCLAISSNRDIAEFLIENGATNEPNEWGITPFYLALKQKDYENASRLAGQEGFCVNLNCRVLGENILAMEMLSSNRPELKKVFSDVALKNIQDAIVENELAFATALTCGIFSREKEVAQRAIDFLTQGNFLEKEWIFQTLFEFVQENNIVALEPEEIEDLTKRFLQPFAHQWDQFLEHEKQIFLDVLCKFDRSDLLIQIIKNEHDASKSAQIAQDSFWNAFALRRFNICQALIDNGLDLSSEASYLVAEGLHLNIPSQKEGSTAKDLFMRRFLFNLWEINPRKKWFFEKLFGAEEVKDFEGGCGASRTMTEYLSSFLTDSVESQHFDLQDRAVYENLMSIYETGLVTPRWSADQIIAFYEKGLPLIFPFETATLGNHVSLISIIGDYLIISDRSVLMPGNLVKEHLKALANFSRTLGETPFMKVYKIDRDVPKENLKILLELNKQMKGNLFDVHDFLYRTLPTELQSQERQDFDPFVEFCNSESLKMPQQKVGNCWIVSPLTGLITIPMALKNLNSPGMNLEENFQKTTTIYNNFVQYFQLKLFKDYLAIKKKERIENIPAAPMDMPLVNEIIKELQKPAWRPKVSAEELDEILTTIQEISCDPQIDSLR